MRAREAGSGLHSGIPIEDAANSEYIQGGRALRQAPREHDAVHEQVNGTVGEEKTDNGEHSRVVGAVGSTDGGHSQ